MVKNFVFIIHEPTMATEGEGEEDSPGRIIGALVGAAAPLFADSGASVLSDNAPLTILPHRLCIIRRLQLRILLSFKVSEKIM